ncbi:SDR family oxidoreductase [Vogesella indigofera]|uniref:SDR family oxidoreductase n=1 Tax=Vogesella indigofera TaxID=45465 RepID=UPI00234E8BEC|nr:SDR family oxidoreductase [Vogesella indigofera]MDC7696408.1 SDR family oxidoreductase [Vogesella indigofera]
MIAITGATGQLGRLVISSLLKKIPADDIIAIVRSVEKAKDISALGVKVRQADYNQPASWDAALQGAEKVLLISSSEIGQRVQQHRAVINAAQRVGVKLLAYTSVLHADTSVLGLADEHRETEAAINASGVPFTLLRNGWYTENYAMGIGAALSLGAVYGCGGDGRISSASRADYAEAAAVVLTSDHQAGKVYELAGDTSYTLSEFAAEISQQSGKSIPYINLAEAEYKKALLGAGLPESLAELLANSDTGVSKGALFDNGQQLSGLIGRPTSPWQVAVRDALN